MTRDDAIQDTYKTFRSCAPYDAYSDKELLDVAANNIDLFIALGMLKLEEPKSAEMRAGRILLTHLDGTDTASILMEFDKAGLKIVEK